MASLGPGCGSNGANPGGPTITQFQFIGQLPSDPYTGIFAISFTSTDGTLGGGKVSFVINGQGSPLTLDVSNLFSAVGLPLNATEGQFGVDLRFANSNLQNGSEATVECALFDSQNRRSNTAEVTLRFTF